MRLWTDATAWAVALAAVAGATTACGNGGNTNRPATTTRPTVPASTATTVVSPTSTMPGEPHPVRVYFLRGEKVGPVSRTATGSAVAASALRQLLKGPSAAERAIGLSSTIPAGTTLLGVSIADKTATVDLSKEFATGGGSAAMMARIAQVVFTLTQFTTVEAVQFKMDGRAVTTLGGEGLVLDRPQRRADWEDLTPAILLETPLPFASVSSPLQLSGTANTFEAVFHVTVRDGGGKVVYDKSSMATSGTGTRGTFDVTATLSSPKSGVGSVRVFEESAKDGEPIHVVTIPVEFT